MTNVAERIDRRQSTRDTGDSTALPARVRLLAQRRVIDARIRNRPRRMGGWCNLANSVTVDWR
jgi:hypothetical protein